MFQIVLKVALLLLARYQMNIATLSETRLSGEDHLIEKVSGYTFSWKGNAEGIKRKVGARHLLSDLI